MAAEDAEVILLLTVDMIMLCFDIFACIGRVEQHLKFVPLKLLFCNMSNHVRFSLTFAAMPMLASC